MVSSIINQKMSALRVNLFKGVIICFVCVVNETLAYFPHWSILNTFYAVSMILSKINLKSSDIPEN